jgi:short-subunit dehydrogenase
MLASLAALAGAAQIAVYSAVKAFQVNYGEGLWAEMSRAASTYAPRSSARPGPRPWSATE